METFSVLLAICAGNSPLPGEFPAQRPVTRSFKVFFDLRLNKRLSKQSWGWWFVTLSRPLWRHCNAPSFYCMVLHDIVIFNVTTDLNWSLSINNNAYKQRVLMHGHQGWNVRHGLCHIYMIYVYIWVVYSFCLFCCLFIFVTTQFVALYKPCKPKPKPSTYDPPDNHPLAEIQIPILRPEPKQQICHQHANTDHFGK